MRGRVNQPTAGVLHGVSDTDWGLVVWMPEPPFAFGSVGALVCTKAKPMEESRANAALIQLTPDMFEALCNIVANARIIPDPAMGGATDTYSVPLDDIEAAREIVRKVSAK